MEATGYYHYRLAQYLFKIGIAEVNLETHAITLLAESPVNIGPGGDYLDGRIYFGSGSHMYSWEVPEK